MAEAGLVEARYPIEGLSCKHCATEVANEVVALPGVESVAFDFTVNPPQLVVQSLEALTTGQVATALEEAGGESFKLGAING